MKTQVSCDRVRLHRYLTGELAEAEEAQLVEHLDECGPCREQLEASAGEPSWWHEARTLLSDDALDETRDPELAAATADGSEAGDALLSKTVQAMLAPTDDP